MPQPPLEQLEPAPPLPPTKRASTPAEPPQTVDSLLDSAEVVFCGWSLKLWLFPFFSAKTFFVLTTRGELRWYDPVPGAAGASGHGAVKLRGKVDLRGGAGIKRTGGGANDFTFRLSAPGSAPLTINPQSQDAYAQWQEGLVRSCEAGLMRA